MVKNHLKNSAIWVRIYIFTKIESIWPSQTYNLSTKFCPKPSITFWDILLTDRQVSKQAVVKTWTLSTFGGGGNDAIKTCDKSALKNFYNEKFKEEVGMMVGRVMERMMNLDEGEGLS